MHERPAHQPVIVLKPVERLRNMGNACRRDVPQARVLAR
jgi:hypothetical protein